MPKKKISRYFFNFLRYQPNFFFNLQKLPWHRRHFSAKDTFYRGSKIFCRHKVAVHAMMKCKKAANSPSVFTLLHDTKRRLSKATVFPEYLLKVTAPLSQSTVHYVLHHDFFGKFFNHTKKNSGVVIKLFPRMLQFIRQGCRPAVSVVRMIQQK